jgi:hypothetical protein
MGLALMAFSDQMAPIALSDDDLFTDHVDIVLFETTTNCNLRCAYCAVSLPWYSGADFELTRVPRLVREMTSAKVASVQISGHGETTMLPQWETFCRAFQDHGIAVSITSNFSKVYTDSEIDAFARMCSITVSIDTVDRELLRKIRRKVDLRTILFNMQQIRLRSLTCYDREPVFNWQCTLSDLVASKLLDWVRMGLLYGVTNFTFGNLIELRGLQFGDVPETKELLAALARDDTPIPRHVARLEREPLLAACNSIVEAVSLALRSKAVVNMQPGIIEGINERLKQFGINEPFSIPAADDELKVEMMRNGR